MTTMRLIVLLTAVTLALVEAPLAAAEDDAPTPPPAPAQPGARYTTLNIATIEADAIAEAEAIAARAATEAEAARAEAERAATEAATVAAAARPAPPPPAGGIAARLAAIRNCESGGNYSTDTGNGYYGAYQFTLGTWAAMGGTGNPALASPAEQDARAAALYDQRGGAPWPVCQYR